MDLMFDDDYHPGAEDSLGLVATDDNVADDGSGISKG